MNWSLKRKDRRPASDPLPSHAVQWWLAALQRVRSLAASRRTRADGHNRSFPTRSQILSRRTGERQVSGDESDAVVGSTRPSVDGGDGRLPSGPFRRRRSAPMRFRLVIHGLGIFESYERFATRRRQNPGRSMKAGKFIQSLCFFVLRKDVHRRSAPRSRTALRLRQPVRVPGRQQPTARKVSQEDCYVRPTNGGSGQPGKCPHRGNNFKLCLC